MVPLHAEEVLRAQVLLRAEESRGGGRVVLTSLVRRATVEHFKEYGKNSFPG